MDKLTKDKIFKAADELIESGERVTLNNVREHLKGGSFTTISQALKEWRKAKEDEKSIKISDIPEDLQTIINNSNDYLKNTFLQFWALTEKILEMKYKEKTEEIIIKNNELEEQLQEYIESIEVLEKEQEELTERLKETEKLFIRADNKNIELEKILKETQSPKRTTRKKTEE